MKLYLDTSDIKEIREADERLKTVGARLDGVTTNPSLAARIAKGSERALKEIFLDIANYLKDVNGPVSVEALGTTNYDPKNVSSGRFVYEARKIHEWHPNFVVKIPVVPEGLEATRTLHGEVPVNMTLVFSLDDAICSAIAGGAYCSPFVGRLDDLVPEWAYQNRHGLSLVGDIVDVFEMRNYPTEILFASVRSPEHVISAYELGSHIATIPYKTFKEMDPEELADMQRNDRAYMPEKPADITTLSLRMPIKDKGVKTFLDDARSVGYEIR